MNLNDPLRTRAEGIKNEYPKRLNGKLGSDGHNKKYYPTNNQGVVDEWAAVVNSQVTAANHQANEEKFKKNKAQNDYRAELTTMTEFKNQERQRDYILKATEKEIADNYAKQNEDQQLKLNKEDKNFRKAMGAEYIKEMANKRRKKIADKLKNIKEENATLPNYEKLEAEEHHKNRMAKIQLRDDQETVLRQRKAIRLRQDNLQQQEDLEYKKSIEVDNTQRDKRQQDY